MAQLTVRFGLVAILWAVFVLPASAEVVSPEPGVGYLDAHGGYVIWSSLDPATDRYSLRVLAGGRVQTLPVPTRPVPFDVDLGPGPDGETVAVYSRCIRDLDRGPGVFSRPVRGVGCRLFAYSFAARTERKLPRARNHASEFSPAVWKDRLVFFAQSGGIRSRISLRTRSIDGRTAGKRLQAGSRGPSAGPVDVDLRGRRIAFTWQGAEGEPASDDGRSLDTRTEAWTVTVGGRRKRLARVPAEGDAPVLVSATVFADAVGYLRRDVSPYFMQVNTDGRRVSTKVEELAFDVAFSLGRTFSFRQVPNGQYEVGANDPGAPGP